jgi:serine phosphatase RsbU (regulator of sigma subunit)
LAIADPTEPTLSIWDPPPGTRATVGWRHVITALVTVAMGTVVGGLGTLSFPVGDTPSGFAPATAIQVVAGIWFGGWGVLAGMLFPAIVRSLTGPDNLPGRVLVDLILCGLPALWFRVTKRDPRLESRADRLTFLFVAVGLTNLLAGVVGTSYLMLFEGANFGLRHWLASVLAWFASGAGPVLVLGFPLLTTLSPVVTRSSLFCRGWWSSPSNLGPSLRRFRHQPIMVKILLGIGAAGFVPLLIVVSISLWDDYRVAREQAVNTQRALAAQIEGNLEQMLGGHEDLVTRYVDRLTRNPLPDPLAERTTALSRLYPTLLADLQTVPQESLAELQEVDNDQALALDRGRTVIAIGPGPRPKRSESIQLMQMVTDGAAAGTVVIDSIELADLERTLFAAARERNHTYGLFTATGRHILASPDFRRPTSTQPEGDFAEAADGRTLLFHRRLLQKPMWTLELMIPQASGIKGVLARQRDYTAVITSIALFAALLVGGYLARALERPIRNLTRTVREAGRLDIEVEAAVYGHDEIGELATTFNEMSRQLRRSIAALERTTAEKERLSYEFEVAAELQRRILPVKPPNAAGFDIAGLCEPAREVGGDFYDWTELSDIRLAVLVGDACGKGMAAAFLINESRSIVRAHLQDSPTAGAALRRTNHTLFHSRTLDDVFTTMFCMVLTVPSRRLDFASAGHPPAILYRSSTGELCELDALGWPLGLEPENAIEENTVTLTAGDVVVAFTDGVIDATNPAGDSFGRERLEQLLRDNHQLSASDLAQHVKRSILQFCAEADQFDDLTLVIIRATELV